MNWWECNHTWFQRRLKHAPTIPTDPESWKMNRNRKVRQLIWDKIISFLQFIFYELAHLVWQWWQTEMTSSDGSASTQPLTADWQQTGCVYTCEGCRISGYREQKWQDAIGWRRYGKRGNLRIVGDAESTGRNCSDNWNHNWRKAHVYINVHLPHFRY